MSIDHNPGPPEDVVLAGMELNYFMLIEGIRHHLPKQNGSFVVGTVTYKAVEQLLNELEAIRSRYRTVRELEKELEKARVARDDGHDEARELRKDVEIFVMNAVGRRSPDLKNFGLKPRKQRRNLTVSEKALMAARARATRELRGTTGKRRKKALKGTADEVVIRADGTQKPTGQGPERTPGDGTAPARTPV